MILLSRLIKSQWAPSAKSEKKVISIKNIHRDLPESDAIVEDYSVEVLEQERMEMIKSVQEEANQILLKANKQAEELGHHLQQERLQFEEEKQMVLEQTKQEGYQQGLNHGREAGYQEYRETIEFAKGIVESSKKDYLTKIDSSDKTILDIGLKVAERILGKRIEEDQQSFLAIVKRAIKEARDYREVQLHVHPVQYGYLLSQKEELMSIFPREIDFYIFPDEDLVENACVIESPNGRIDASVNSQLEEIKRKLFEVLESE
ncbi:flagellar assembly protein FliH [Cytobacillus spongiae]|uniref:flagellar assembly protein FliH n=1 Tax=Cytobacillus spongiae TaxID=2901381 RepID=UPI0032C4B034